MVDTLHVKVRFTDLYNLLQYTDRLAFPQNLLSLGEDRYLTTIMMKAFPEFKMAFCKDATAQTIAPDDWKVLMSQRRRWINSTVHNLAELLFVDKMCGFCCFSMRFVVFVGKSWRLFQLHVGNSDSRGPQPRSCFYSDCPRHVSFTLSFLIYPAFLSLMGSHLL